MNAQDKESYFARYQPSTRDRFAVDDHAPSAMYRGVKILHDPVRNKGTAYTEAERDYLSLAGPSYRPVCTRLPSRNCAS